MRRVTILPHRFLGFFSLITGIGAKVLFHFPMWFPHPVFQDGFDLRAIMSVCSGYDDRQWDTMLVDQNVTLASIFFPDPWGYVPRIPELSEPLSCIRRYSAISRQCLPFRHIRPDPFSKASRTIPLSPISESIDEHCWNCRIPSEGLSIGFLYGEFTQFSIFRSKCRKSIISTSENAHYVTKSRAFSFEKNGGKWAKIRHLWGKNGEVF